MLKSTVNASHEPNLIPPVSTNDLEATSGVLASNMLIVFD